MDAPRRFQKIIQGMRTEGGVVRAANLGNPADPRLAPAGIEPEKRKGAVIIGRVGHRGLEEQPRTSTGDEPGRHASDASSKFETERIDWTRWNVS